jgi:hypothetical protein
VFRDEPAGGPAPGPDGEQVGDTRWLVRQLVPHRYGLAWSDPQPEGSSWPEPSFVAPGGDILRVLAAIGMAPLDQSTPEPGDRLTLNDFGVERVGSGQQRTVRITANGNIIDTRWLGRKTRPRRGYTTGDLTDAYVTGAIDMREAIRSELGDDT